MPVVVHTHEMRAHEGFYEDLARQNTRRTSVPAPATLSASSYMGFYVVVYRFQSSS
jgi:hypothetical protein